MLLGLIRFERRCCVSETDAIRFAGKQASEKPLQSWDVPLRLFVQSYPHDPIVSVDAALIAFGASSVEKRRGDVPFSFVAYSARENMEDSIGMDSDSSCSCGLFH